ncbi:MAG: Nramp family divalent metal transporter [Candidatus Azobacteroides sp.]|nr:Nramp family divalent metal transporter [Candidatus Azobacteroides sp.]
MKHFFKKNLHKHRKHHPVYGGLEILKYIGPGLLVTMGFIDPGNWATNIAAGSTFGYSLLWIVTLGTIILIVLQHNAAHLGIVTGLCLSEAVAKYTRPAVSRTVLGSAMLASISTSLAEILGSAIALEMLFHVPLKIGAALSSVVAIVLLLTNSYQMIERWIIGFVSLIGVAFIYELSLVDVEWVQAAKGVATPSFPKGSLLIILSVLGAVVMPHNLFLHSEIVQSRQLQKGDDQSIKKLLKFEFADTLFSMILGWAINCAMFIMAAAIFFQSGQPVEELQDAHHLLKPLLGDNASTIFAVALLMAGIASTITSGIAGGSIFAGIFSEPYDIKDSHSRGGVLLSIGGALIVVFFISNPFHGLLISQMLLSFQLPFTVLAQVYLTSSKKVMGRYANTRSSSLLIIIMAIAVIGMNLALLVDVFF